jgi:FAD/FMN-containing dehydrogenase
VVFDRLSKLGGSISAEHGIGMLKKQYLPYSRSAEEISTMQLLKRSLDPENILNPGKVC